MDLMMKRQLGKTNLMLSPLGLGTVKLGRNADVKYPQPFELPTDHEVTTLLKKAQRLGVNFIDTAPAYGSSEQRLGQLLPSPRSDWVIATKVGETYQQNCSEFNFEPQNVVESIDRSLRNLRLEQLDLVLIHSDGINESIEKFGPAFHQLKQLKEQEIIRAFGISPKTIEGAHLGIQNTDVVMLTLNQNDPTMLDAIELAEHKNVGVIIKKGFASGHFRESTAVDSPPNPVLAALKFIFRNPGITSVVVGTISPGHLQENAQQIQAILRHSGTDEPQK